MKSAKQIFLVSNFSTKQLFEIGPWRAEFVNIRGALVILPYTKMYIIQSCPYMYRYMYCSSGFLNSVSEKFTRQYFTVGLDN